MKSLYKNSTEYPYHLSVGVVLFNRKGNILCECFGKETCYKLIGKEQDMRVLIRETLEEGETLREAVARGLREEVNMSGEIICLLGSKEDLVIEKEKTFLKTTVYFLVKTNEETVSEEGSDDGVSFTIEWHTPENLSRLMNEQSDGLERTDLNESDIILRAEKYITNFTSVYQD